MIRVGSRPPRCPGAVTATRRRPGRPPGYAGGAAHRPSLPVSAWSGPRLVPGHLLHVLAGTQHRRRFGKDLFTGASQPAAVRPRRGDHAVRVRHDPLTSRTALGLPASYDHAAQPAPPRKRAPLFLSGAPGRATKAPATPLRKAPLILGPRPGACPACSCLVYRGNRVIRSRHSRLLPPGEQQPAHRRPGLHERVRGRHRYRRGFDHHLLVVDVILGVICRMRRSGRAERTWHSAAGAASGPGGRRSESSLIKPVPGRAGGRNDNTGASPTVPGGSQGRLRPGSAHRCPVLDTTVRLAVDRRALL